MIYFIEQCAAGIALAFVGFPFFMLAWFCVLQMIDPD